MKPLAKVLKRAATVLAIKDYKAKVNKARFYLAKSEKFLKSGGTLAPEIVENRWLKLLKISQPFQRWRLHFNMQKWTDPVMKNTKTVQVRKPSTSGKANTSGE